MAYFSNGTEGEMYQEQWCSRCRHEGDCPVWHVHIFYNYDQQDSEDVKDILDTLIPRNEDGTNAACNMFVLGAGALVEVGK